MTILKAALCGLSLVAAAHAQAASDPPNYPARPVTIVVPYAPGGAVDVIARTTGEALSKQLHQTFIVENRPGAGGNIASAYVARATADGYTLLMGEPSRAAAGSLYKELQYDPVRGLKPIALVGSAPSVLLVPTDSPAKTLNDLVQMAQKKPGELTYGHGGNGTTSEHLASEMFLGQAKIQMISVPYSGGAAAMTDLMGGRLNMVTTNMLNAAPHLQGNRMRALAVADTRRSPMFPDVPTFAEAGYPKMEVGVWWGLMAPAAVPQNVVDTLNRAVNDALKTPELQARLKALNATPLGGDQPAFQARFDSEVQQWATIIKQAGLQLQ